MSRVSELNQAYYRDMVVSDLMWFLKVGDMTDDTRTRVQELLDTLNAERRQLRETDLR
jgi:hypothetical protein